jgi:hypothetical protein
LVPVFELPLKVIRRKLVEILGLRSEHFSREALECFLKTRGQAQPDEEGTIGSHLSFTISTHGM